MSPRSGRAAVAGLASALLACACGSSSSAPPPAAPDTTRSPVATSAVIEGWGTGIAVVGSTAFVSRELREPGGGFAIRAVDLSDPAHPALGADSGVLGSDGSVGSADGKLLVLRLDPAHTGSTEARLDEYDPVTLRTTGRAIAGLWSAGRDGIPIDGGRAYLAAGDLVVVDPASFEVVSRYRNQHIWQVAVKGDRAYLLATALTETAVTDFLDVVDLTTISSPRSVGTVTFPAGDVPEHIAVVDSPLGRRLWVARAGWVHQIDLTDEAHPAFSRELRFLARGPMAVAGHRALVPVFPDGVDVLDGGVLVLDPSNPDAPVPFGRLADPAASGVVVMGHHAVVLDHTGIDACALSVFDLTGWQ
jgi:hypothetical protein